MKRYILALTAALIIFTPLVMSKPRPSLQEPNQPVPSLVDGTAKVAAGKVLYEEQCQKCHGDKGQGNPKMYKLVRATIVHLGAKVAQEKSDEEIGKSVTDGFNKMEAIPELSREDIDKVVAFVRTLKLEVPKN